jgi:hypothetical protein
MKLPNVNPPSNSIVIIPYPNRVGAYCRSMRARCTAAVGLLRAITDEWWRPTASAGLSRFQPVCGMALIRRA